MKTAGHGSRSWRPVSNASTSATWKFGSWAPADVDEYTALTDGLAAVRRIARNLGALC